MTIYRGLNVSKALSDIDDAREALKSLGLRREDFDVIAGLTSAEVGVGISDFHNMANLTSDQKKELESLATAADYTEIEFLKVNDISTPLKFNLRLDDDKFVGGAIKYNYLNYSVPTVNGDYVVQGADISTSRLSSWSPVGDPNPDDYILYGGDVKVRGDTLKFTKLTTTEEPIAKSFRAEVPTHVLTSDIFPYSYDDQATDGGISLYLMKGIPLTWEGVFEEIVLKAAVGPTLSDSEGTIPITWRITNLQQPAGSYNSGDGSNNTSSVGTGSLYSPVTYTISPSGYIKRKIEFFYDPSRVLRLELTNANISKWVPVSLPNCKWINIGFNDFNCMPEFRSDGSIAKQGFSGGAGLAPTLDRLYITGNNLGRGNDALLGTDRENTANSSQQCNRLPTTLRYLIANGCFTDNVTIDLEDYEDLYYMDLGSQYTRELRRPQTASISPKTFNPKHRRFFSVESNEWITYRINNQLYVPSHGFSTGDAVRYDYHADSDGVMGEPISTILNPSSTTYYVRRMTSNTIELYPSLAEANASPSTTGRLVMTAAGGVGHGTLHSLIKWDTSTNSAYMSSTTKGIVYYRIYNQSYSQMSPGAYNSPRLYQIYFNATPIKTNSETPYFSETASANGTVTADQAKIKSSKDMALPKFESDTNFYYFYSRYNPHNVVDFSGNNSIRRYYDWQGKKDLRYAENERTIAGKFNNCPKLTHILMYGSENSTGDFSASNTFQNMPELRYSNMLVWGSGGPTGRISNSTFVGSDKLNDWSVGGSQLNQFTDDCFGTSGLGGPTGDNTGRALENANPDFRHFRFGGNLYGGGTLVAEGNNEEGSATYDFVWPVNTTFRTLYLYRNNIRGTFPNVFNSFRNLYALQIGYQASWMKLYHANPKQIYKITNTYLNNGTPNKNNMTTNDWKAVGWIASQSEAANIAICGPEYGNATGTTPANGDAFKHQLIPIAENNPNNYLRNRYYRIMRLGTTDWNAICVGGNANPYLGQKIEFNSSVTITAQIAGTGGAVNPWSDHGNVRALGLTGTFPPFSQPMPLIRYFDIYLNHFSGQIPKVDCPNIQRYRAQYNLFTGSIPDFSACTNRLKKIELFNNRLTTYEQGNLSTCVYLEKLDLRNNQLQASILRDLVLDLIENYTARNRGGVTVNLRGQSGGNRLQESSKFDGTSGENSTKNKLDWLRSEAGWTILLD